MLFLNQVNGVCMYVYGSFITEYVDVGCNIISHVIYCNRLSSHCLKCHIIEFIIPLFFFVVYSDYCYVFISPLASCYFG